MVKSCAKSQPRSQVRYIATGQRNLVCVLVRRGSNLWSLDSIVDIRSSQYHRDVDFGKPYGQSEHERRCSHELDRYILPLDRAPDWRGASWLCLVIDESSIASCWRLTFISGHVVALPKHHSFL